MPPPSSKSNRGSNEFFTDDAYSAGHYSEKEYNEYKKDQVFNPSTPRVLAFLVFAFGIVGAVHGLLELIDANVIHGVRYISHCILAYIVLHFCWIWTLCRITLWRTSKRGIQVVERDAFKVRRNEEVAKLKKELAGKFKSVPRIITFSGNGGGGHEATLRGLKTLLTEVEFPCEIIEVPLAYLIEFHKDNPLRNIFGVTGEQLYNWGLLLGAGGAWFMSHFTSWAQYFALIADDVCGLFGDLLGVDYGNQTGKLLERIFTFYQPDLVLDFTQGTGRFIYSGLERSDMMHTPVVRCVSDFEGRGAHSWIEHKDQYIMCGTSCCRQQALDFGIEERRVFQMSGMVIRPDFYGPSEGGGGSRREMLAGLGLDPDRRCVLVCWGGVGSEKIVKIGKAIAKSSKRVNIIFMCGNNGALKGTLSAMDWGDVKVLILGFTDKVPFYMQVSDMCVCKPGPGVASEACALALPMIIEWSAFTLPQEVPVSRWVVERGLGLGFAKIDQITGCVERMCGLLGDDMSKYFGPIVIKGEGLTGVDAAPQHNRAVFEIPAIINKVLETHDFTPRPKKSGSIKLTTKQD